MLSILIPAYNAEQFITTAICSACRQTDRFPVQILVCDDGSTDQTASILRQLQRTIPILHVVSHNQNRGVSAARNTLLYHIHPGTTFVTFFDADDVYVDYALEHLLKAFDSVPALDFVRGRMQVVPSSILEGKKLIAPTWPILHGITLSASLIRRELVARVGAFNEALTHGEDLDYLIWLGETTLQRQFLDAVVFYYRRHQANATGNGQALRRGVMQAMLLHAKRKAADPTLHSVSGLLQTTDPEVLQRILTIQ